MNSLPESTVSLPAEQSKSGNSATEMTLHDDRCFLLYFIMGTYFGPDLKDQKQQKSALQRKAEGLSLYTSDHLAGSHMKAVEVERIYYYVLKKADQSLRAKLPFLRQFVQGKCEDFPANYPQFPDLFPLGLHQQFRFKNQYKVIENVVFINNPETFYMRPEHIARFKRLTGLQDFLQNRYAALLHATMACSETNNDSVQETESNKELTSNNEPKGEVDRGEKAGPAMIFLPSHPTNQELANIAASTKSGFALTGTPAMGQVGRIVGLMDIGECEDSYLFRVSLPGVKRDAREFGCEVEDNGKVLIRGVTTTGEKRVSRYSQVFEMQTQNLCPPGHFTLSFQLPGPVDPQQFTGNFGTDGILEGIVMKKIDKQLI